ncbi:hypothetical protein NG900_01985 [Ralstonia sp. 21MJYT02-11]|uniref:Uncharacterized protein n=1 Tax=Ralstonia soli TaxID=2953896 RepID=A0ABT1AF63_9RALS|nr:hypothetical protein [Ralstonia soli]
MNTTQRLTVRSGGGALYVIAVWQGMAPYTDRVRAVSAHIDPERGEECLAIDVDDVCASQLYLVAAALNQSLLPMTATVERSPAAGYAPA